MTQPAEDLRVPTLFTFHRSRPGDFGTATFGPYLSEYEAKEAFQRILGYWPGPAISSEPWKDPNR